MNKLIEKHNTAIQLLAAMNLYKTSIDVMLQKKENPQLWELSKKFYAKRIDIAERCIIRLNQRYDKLLTQIKNGQKN